MFEGRLFLAACAIAAPITASAQQAQSIMPGTQIIDPSGAPVGTVYSVKGDQLVVRTDKHDVRLPASPFAFDKGKLVFALTREQLNKQTEQAIAEANAKLVVGTPVYGTGGALAGTIQSIDGSLLTLKLTSGKLIRLPRNAVAPNVRGAVLGMSAAELQRLIEQAR